MCVSAGVSIKVSSSPKIVVSEKAASVVYVQAGQHVHKFSVIFATTDVFL
jgi:hypothetical protein